MKDDYLSGLLGEIETTNAKLMKLGSAEEFTDMLFDTIRKDNAFPKFRASKFNSEECFCNRGEKWIIFNYSGHSYKINVELIGE